MPPTATSRGGRRGRYYGASPTLRTESVASPSTAVSFMTDSKGDRRSIMSPPLTLHVVPSDGIDLDSRGSHIRQHTSSQILSIHEATELQHGSAFDTSKNGRRDLLPTIERDTCDELRRQRSITVPFAYQRATDHCESKSGFGKLVDRVRHPRTWRKYKEGLAVISKRTMKTHDRDHSPQTTTAHSFLHQIPAFDTKSTSTDPTNDTPIYLTVKETLEQEAMQRAEEAKANANLLSVKAGRWDTEMRKIGHVPRSLCSGVTHRFGDIWKASVGRKSGARPERVRLRKKRPPTAIDSADDSVTGTEGRAAAHASRAQPSPQIRRTRREESVRNVESRVSSHSSNRSYRSARQSLDILARPLGPSHRPNPHGHSRHDTATLSQKHSASSPNRYPPKSPLPPRVHAWSPLPTAVDTRSRTAKWAGGLCSEVFDDTPSLAGSLYHGLSRASTLGAASVTSSVAYPTKDPSPWELQIAASMTGGRDIARSDTGLSGTTAYTSPESEKSSHAPWASGRGSTKSGKQSRYVLNVMKSPSEYSLDSTGEKPPFPMLDTRVPLQDQRTFEGSLLN